MRMFILLIFLCASFIVCAEEATTPLPEQKDYHKAYRQLITQAYDNQVGDFYKDYGVIRRDQWTDIEAEETDDQECYDMFQLLNQKKVSLKRNISYLKKMRQFYQGGRIILHHTMSDLKKPNEKIIKFHKGKGWGDLSYHFLIDNKTCNPLEGRPLHMVPVAAGHMPSRVNDCLQNGDQKYDISNDFDYKSVNIAWVGNANTKDEKPSKSCEKKIAAFIKGLAKTLNIANIGGHGHYTHYEHDCPGAHLAAFLSKFPLKHKLNIEGTGEFRSGKNIYDAIFSANLHDNYDPEKDYVAVKKMQRDFSKKIPHSKAMKMIRRGESLPKNTLVVNDSSSQPVYCGKCGNQRKKFPKWKKK